MSLRQKLKSVKRKVIKEVTLGEHIVHLARPTPKERIAIITAAKDAGEIGEDEKPVSFEAGLRTIARMAAAIIVDPLTGELQFDGTKDEDVNEVCSAQWLEDITRDVQAAFMPGFEEVKGNS